jgi:GNAT superfamily N-acetyltransferase
MNVKLELSDVADEEVRRLIVAPLIEYNTNQAGPGNGRPVVITVKDNTGHVVGGLWGYTGYEWLFTQLLVVPASHRKAGTGSRLMRMAEAEAMSRGCIGAWLDTFEFQARGFYERLGYECFAELPNYPTGFSRYFMKKSLQSSADEA